METAQSALRGETGRRLQDALLIDILDHAPDAIGVVEAISPARRKYVFIYANEAFETLYIAKRSEAIGSDVAEFFSTRSIPGDVKKTADLMAEGKPFTNTRVFTRRDGSTVWLEVSYRPIPMPDQPVRWIFVARDVTVKKLLQDRAMQLSIAVEEGDDLVAISAADEGGDAWRFTYVNEAFTRATGYRPEEIVGKSFAAILEGPGSADLPALRTRTFSGEPVRFEVQYRHKSGRVGTLVVNSKPIADPITGRYTSLVTIFRDVTEERAHAAQLLYEAEHDPLSGLHNRRYFERMLNDSISMEPPAEPQHAVVFIDLDAFKAVNDELGHAVGDQVLKAAAAAFARCVSGSDVLVRWGGDEFAALLFHCTVRSASEIAQTMLQELRGVEAARSITASVGVAPVLPGETAEESIQRADRAAYAAKAAGGDRVAVQTA